MIVSLRRALQTVLLAALCATPFACNELAPAGDPDLLRGRNALLMSRFDWARSYFAADLERNPNRLESLRGSGLGWISGFNGSLTKAVESFEKYLELVPEDAEIRLRLARAFLSAGDQAGAREAIRALPASIEADLVAARISIGSEPGAALTRLEPALRLTPESFEAHFLAARAHDRLGSFEDAIAALGRAIEINPLNTDTFYLKAQILRRQGRTLEADEALEAFEIVNQLPGCGFVAAPARELAVLRQIEARFGSGSLIFRRRLARVLLELGDVQSARPLLVEIAASEGTAPEVLLGLAQAAHTRGKVVVARELYDTVLARDPDSLEALSSRARLASEVGEPQLAQAMLRWGFEVEPHYAPLHFVSGLLALAEGDEVQARAALERAVELVPWLPRYRLTLADVYLTDGDLGALRELLEDSPTDGPLIAAYKVRHAL